MGNDYSINSTVPDDPAQLDGSRLKLRLPPAPRWQASRPGEVALSPGWEGELLGSPAPDAGYVLKLLRMVEPSITGVEGTDRLDLRAAIQVTALRRASVLGRAPTLSDLEWALAYWGFGLAGKFDPSGVSASGMDPTGRDELFKGCAHDALRQRKVAASVDPRLAGVPARELAARRTAR